MTRARTLLAGGAVAVAVTVVAPAVTAAPANPNLRPRTSCGTPAKWGASPPPCVREIARRAARLYGDPTPLRRVWVRTTMQRAGIVTASAPRALRRRVIAMVVLTGSFPKAPGASRAAPFQSVQFALDPVARRTVLWVYYPAGAPSLRRLGTPRRF